MLNLMERSTHCCECVPHRVRLRFFDQAGHEIMSAFSGNKHFSQNLVIVRLTKIINRADKNWVHFQ